MSKALNLLERVEKVQKVLGSTSIREDDVAMDYSSDSSNEEPSGENQVDISVPSNSNEIEKLEDKLNSSLTDIGLVSCEVMKEEDGDVYADLSFEDGTSVSLQFYVEELTPKVSLLSDENQENVPEVILPDNFANENGELVLSVLDELPLEQIKDMVSEKIGITNQVEVYRRSRTTSESFAMKRMKRRVSNKYKNECLKLKKQIKFLKSK